MAEASHDSVAVDDPRASFLRLEATDGILCGRPTRYAVTRVLSGELLAANRPKTRFVNNAVTIHTEDNGVDCSVFTGVIWLSP
jgi:hypothetical protein